MVVSTQLTTSLSKKFMVGDSVVGADVLANFDCS